MFTSIKKGVKATISEINSINMEITVGESGGRVKNDIKAAMKWLKIWFN